MGVKEEKAHDTVPDTRFRDGLELQREGKVGQAKEIFLKLYEESRGSADFSAQLMRQVGQCSIPDEAIGYFLRAAKLWLGVHKFQSSLNALELAQNCCVSSTRKEDIAKIAELEAKVKKEMPHNLEECFLELERMLSPDQLPIFKKLTPIEICGLHTSLGRAIRNEWGLWAGSELSKNLAKNGVTHPDDMSSYVLFQFQQYLNNKGEK